MVEKNVKCILNIYELWRQVKFLYNQYNQWRTGEEYNVLRRWGWGEEETENEREKESGRQGLVIRHTSSPEQDERNQIT